MKLISVAMVITALPFWLLPAISASAQSCMQNPPLAEACVTGFDLEGNQPAAAYILPLACQFNLTRELNKSLAAKGYNLSAGQPLNDYQLSPLAMAAIRCERKHAGLGSDSALDRATVRLILGRDVLAERCEAAHVSNNCPILAGAPSR